MEIINVILFGYALIITLVAAKLKSDTFELRCKVIELEAYIKVYKKGVNNE